MTNEKSELRQILDLFENAGFTVTYYLHYDEHDVFDISFKSNSVKNAGNDEEEPASAGEITVLVEKHNYKLLEFKRGAGISGKYAGTIFIVIKAVPANPTAAE